MKHFIISAFAIAILHCTCTGQAATQTAPATSTRYYRYFVVHTGQVNEAQVSGFVNAVNHKAYYQEPILCPRQGKIMIKVDVANPTRVAGLIEEIGALYHANTRDVPSARVEKIDFETSKNFCK